MEKNKKYGIMHIMIALCMAMIMILQPVSVLAAALTSEMDPEGENIQVLSVEEGADPLKLPLVEELNTISETDSLGWMDQEKTEGPFKAFDKMVLNLYIHRESVQVQRLILQNTAAIDLGSAQAAGIKITETENNYSDKAFYKEYELQITTDKQAMVFPLSLEINSVKEGIFAAVLGGNAQGQWVKADIIAKNNELEIADRIEGSLLTEGKSLETILGEEKAAAEKALQEAQEKALADQEEAAKAEQKALEEQKTLTENPQAPTQEMEPVEQNGEISELAEGEDASLQEESQSTEASDIRETNTQEALIDKDAGPVSENTRTEEQSSEQEKGSVFITTLETGTESGIIGATYELANITDPNHKYLISGTENFTGSLSEIPYGEYTVKQIAAGEGYLPAAEIPNISVDSEKEEIQIENKKIEPGEILAPLALTEEITAPTTIEEAAVQSIQRMALAAAEPIVEDQLSTLYITTVQEGNPEIKVEGAYYELQNIEDETKIYKAGPSDANGLMTLELPYGKYKVIQIGTGFGYNVGPEIPDLVVNDTKEGIIVENTAQALDLRATAVEEPVMTTSTMFRSAMLPASLNFATLAAVSPTDPRYTLTNGTGTYYSIKATDITKTGISWETVARAFQSGAGGLDTGDDMRISLTSGTGLNLLTNYNHTVLDARSRINYDVASSSGSTYYHMRGDSYYGPFTSNAPATTFNSTFTTNFSSGTATPGTYEITLNAWMADVLTTSNSGGTQGITNAKGSITIHSITTTINPLYADSKVITGMVTNNRLSLTPSDNIVTININGTNYTTAINPDGTYAFTLPAGVSLAQGNVINVIGSNGLVTSPASTTVQKSTTGSLTINKVDEKNQPLTGAKFTLTRSGSTPIQIDMTNASTVKTDGIPNGTYTLTEDVAPVNYDKVGPRTITVDGNSQSITVTNNRSRGSLTIEKQDQNGNPLQGAVFTLSDGTNSYNYDMRFATSMTTGQIPYGTYTLTETTVPDGFIGIAPQTVVISSPTQVLPVKNTLKATDVTINKTGAGGAPLADAGFTLTGTNGTTGTFVFDNTNTQGTTSLAGVPYGTYTLSETRVPAGYLKLADQTITLSTTTRTLNLSNTPAPRGNLTIHKTGDGGSPLAGAGFTLTGIKDTNGTYTSTTSDSNGVATFVNVPYGTYTLTESTVPEGYGQAPNQTITINAAGLSISVSNTLVPKGSLIIQKTGVGGAPLAGAGFTLEGNGKTYTSNTTGSTGIATITGIDYGTYTLRESTVPGGYAISPDRQVTINSSTQTIQVSNYLPGAFTESMTLINEDVDNPNIKLAGGVFEITGPGVKYTVQTDSTGRVLLNNLPQGSYTVTQIKAPDGYSLMPNDLTFTLNGVPGEVHAQNKKLPESTRSIPYVEIDVKDQISGVPIEGVTVKLTGTDGSVRYTLTGADGKAIFENLDYGVTYVGSVDDAPFMYEWPNYTPTPTPPLPISAISPIGVSTLTLIPVEKNDLIIRLTEFDNIDILIPNAQFLITDPDGNTKTVTTDQNGMIRENLYHGTYTIQQLTTDGTHVKDPTVYSIFIERYEELMVQNKLINPASSTQNITVTKYWGDPAPANPNVKIDLLANGTKVAEQTITSGNTTTITFPNQPTYDGNHYKLEYTVREQPLTGYYAVNKMLDDRGYAWSITNYTGEVIGECKTGTFWTSSNNYAYERRNDTGALTGRTINLATPSTSYTDTFGYSLAASRDGNYLYAVNRYGYLRIYDVSKTVIKEVTTTPINLKTMSGGNIYTGTEDYVHAATVSDDGTKLFVKSWKGTTIYEYNTATLLANIAGGTVRSTQHIASTYSSGDIVYMPNGDLLVSAGQQNTIGQNEGLYISVRNPDGVTYSSPAVKVGTISSSINSYNGSVGQQGMGLVDGQLVVTSTIYRAADNYTYSYLYKIDQLPSTSYSSTFNYTHTLFVTTTDQPTAYSDMTSGSNSTCEAYIKVAGQKLWENDEPADRPQSITVELYRNGQPTGIRQTVTAANNWSYIFGDSVEVAGKLPKYDANNNAYVYTVREVGVPTGYIAVYPPTTEANNYNITNKYEATELYLHKKDETGASMAGVQFSIYAQDKINVVAGPEFTDPQGRITFTGLTVGNYFLKENAAKPGYQLDPNYYPVEVYKDPLTGAIKARVTKDGVVYENSLGIPIEITNAKITGDLEMEKKNTLGQVLPGAEFTLSQGTTEIGKQTSGTDGKLRFENLAPGTYTLKETKVPAGYNANDTVYTVTVDGQGKVRVTVDGKDLAVNPLVIYNQPTLTEGYLNLSKTIHLDGSGNRPGKINGVTFELRYSDEARTVKDGQLVGTGSGSTATGTAITGNTVPIGGTLPENGIATFTGLADGYYYLKETGRPTPPTGTEWTTPMAEHFIKVENGIAYVWKNDTWLDASVDGSMYDTDHSIDVYNPYGNPLKATLQKVDGNDATVFLDAQFQLYVGNTEATSRPYYDANGQTVIVNTTADGALTEFTIPSSSGTYWLKEIVTPSGYNTMEKMIGPILVTEANGVYSYTLADDAGPPSYWSVAPGGSLGTNNITAKNYQDLYPITLEKINQDNGPLMGMAVFEVYRAEDYGLGNMTPVTTITTIDSMPATSDDLFLPGDYYIREIQPPEGYIGLTEDIKVNLSIINGLPVWTVDPGSIHLVGTSITEGAIAIKNELMFYPVSVLKVDASGNPIDTATFSFYREGDYQIVDGKVHIDIGVEPVAVLTTAGGMATSDPVFSPGNYAIIESEAPAGYIGMPEPAIVSLSATGGIPMWTLIQGRADFININDGTTITVTNRQPVYPATGGIGSMIFLVGGLAIMGAALVLNRKKRGDAYP
ncbi:MAG: SpaA isopeptide-forming pilin-related protein [Gallicola sp.]|nr:SpaA isopeptide-forming pilin-related protein [Gallicola sp.]